MRSYARLAALLAVAALAAAPAQAQQFGQNKVTYERFEWKVYPSPHFDIHYYGPDEAFLQEVVSYAESAYLGMSRDLDHELRFRVPLIVYRNHAEFSQTNITMDELPEAVGAFAEPVQNRMVVPLDQPPDRLYSLIAHELTHIFQYSIFFEGYLGRALRSNPPAWIMEGMASYLARDEDSIDRMVMRDAVVANLLPPIQDLSYPTFLAYRYGHAIFDFIEKEHGKEGFRSFVYEYRKVLLTNNLEKAIKESFGYDIAEFNRRFVRYLQKRYLPVLLEKKAPEDYGKEIGLKEEGVYTFSPTISPSGELVAVLASPKLEIDLLVLSADGVSRPRNLTRGWTNRWRFLVAEAFEGRRDLSWSPAGDEIAVFARRENRRQLLVFDALSGKRLRTMDLPGIAECASPAFSPDGKRIAFEGNRDGIVDVFELDLDTGEIRNATQDDAYDANPWYAPDGKTLAYNRRVGRYWKVFSVDLADPSRKQQLTFGSGSDVQPAYSRDGSTLFFSSDRGSEEIFNIHALDLASGEIRRYTDVVGGCFSPVESAERDGERQLVFVSFFRGTFRLFRMPLLQPESRTEAVRDSEAQPEIEAFEPPLRLTPDPAKISPYRPKWDLEMPLFAIGVTNDGTVLADAAVQFSDLLGNQRIRVVASSVSTYSNVAATYLNFEHRTRWGATFFDYRDYYADLYYDSIGESRQQIQRTTGGVAFLQFPLSRHYRAEGSLGVVDRSQDYIYGIDPTTGDLVTDDVRERFAIAGLSFTGDTTRFQSFGPFQGKRFTVGATWGTDVGSDYPGNLLEYALDFRAYKQLTRRSLLAFRAAGAWSAGDRPTYYSLGGINVLRGYDYREFFGTRVAWANAELRFPLVDAMAFPFGVLRDIRGFLFADVGAAWFEGDAFYDPELGRWSDFRLWDSENDRLQSGRGSYGWGIQLLFLGGLQFNWAWSHRMDYTTFDGTGAPVAADTGGTRTDFYIVYDF